MTSAWTSLLWFVAIVVMIPAALWLLKRTPVGAGLAPGLLRTVAVLPLSPGQRVVTVEVGSGEARRWLVLGVTAQTITALHEMPAQGDATAATPPASPFAQLLDRARR